MNLPRIVLLAALGFGTGFAVVIEAWPAVPFFVLAIGLTLRLCFHS